MTPTPPNRAGALTERIMARIREHLKGGAEPEGNRTHHYNRVYEAVYDVLSRETRLAEEERPAQSPGRRCGKLLARRGSIGRCDLEAGHAGKCWRL